MKKVLIILSLFFLTGCTNTVSYNFTESGIESKITSTFTDMEFVSYNNSTTSHDFQISAKDAKTHIQMKYDEYIPAATKVEDNYKYYEKDTLDTSNRENVASYKYTFSYNEFPNNYFLRKCFDSFTVYDSNNFTYYKVSGKFSCEKPETVTIKVKSGYKIVESNEDEITQGEYIWKVKANDNNIVFAISKKEKAGVTISIAQIFTLVVIVLTTIISAIIMSKANKME